VDFCDYCWQSKNGQKEKLAAGSYQFAVGSKRKTMD
jgi:hypothetical protein